MNAGKDQAILILPQRSGIYTLQLVARNVRGVVSSSNQMRVIVEEIAGVKPATSGYKPPALPTESESDSSSEETRHSDSEPNSTPRSRSAPTAHGNSRSNQRHAGVHDLTHFKRPENIEEAARLLGVTLFNTIEEIARVRRRLALMYHPDRSTSTTTQQINMERMQTIVEAYDMLNAYKASQ